MHFNSFESAHSLLTYGFGQKPRFNSSNEVGKQAVWPDWVIYCILGNFSKPVATISLPKLPTFIGNFFKLSKSIILLVKSFWATFIVSLAIFSWSHCLNKTMSDCTAPSPNYFFYRQEKIPFFARGRITVPTAVVHVIKLFLPWRWL